MKVIYLIRHSNTGVNIVNYVDYKNSGQAELVWESEIGVMVNAGTALYIKPGAHLGGNWKTRDWTLNMGFKILYL